MISSQITAKPSGRRKLVPFALVFLVSACGLLFAFRDLGHWLELDEPLRPAAAIVVLGGGFPFRAIEAATLYRNAWAKEVWLTPGKADKGDAALAAIGFTTTAEYESSRAVLEKLGVPPANIRIIPIPVENTVAELRAIRDYAQNRSPGPVILVSSRSHTRRVRVIWNRVTPANRIAIVRYTPEDPFDAARWWHTTSDAIAAFREAFGIVNAWAGFPMAPRERS